MTFKVVEVYEVHLSTRLVEVSDEDDAFDVATSSHYIELSNEYSFELDQDCDINCSIDPLDIRDATPEEIAKYKPCDKACSGF